jgi:biotin carboxylase
MILVVDSGTRQYRGSTLEAAAKLRSLWLLNPSEPTWQVPHVVATTVVDYLDPALGVPDADRLVAAAEKIAAEQPIDGILTYSEFHVVATARITEALGRPGLSVAAAENCRDKHRTRRALTDAGLLQPRFAWVHDAETARAAAADIGYPVVFKPRGLGASIGVVRVDDPEQLESAVRATQKWLGLYDRNYTDGFLVEEMIEGPEEISVDGFVSDGVYEPFIVARKKVGIEPYFVEVEHRVDAADPLLEDKDLRAMLAAAHRALGVDHGITHTEIKLTDRGPTIVEVNGRLGGDMIAYLGRLASGVDGAEIAVALATGVRPVVKPTTSGCAAVRFFYPPAEGIVETIEVPDHSAVSGLVESQILTPVGADVWLPPNRYLSRSAYVVCVGPDADTCDAALSEASSRVTVTVAPKAEAE